MRRLYVKELSKPVKISVLEVLLKRLVDHHPKQSEIERDLTLLVAGYKGEKAVSYYLNFLPKKDYYIFHSLRLPNNGHYFQMDYLLLTTRFALILECKNFFGTLFFDQSFHQLIRTVNDKEEGFHDPLSQVKWHQHQLQNLFHTWRCPLPIEYFVVIGNPSTIVKTNPQNRHALTKVVHGHRLLNNIQEIERKFQKEVYDVKKIRKLSKLLVKQHTPETFDPIQKYGLTYEDILTGVKCPECGQVGMIYNHGSWKCQQCQIKKKDAHAESLKDYALLISPTITNQEFRRFFHVTCPDVANYLLKKLQLSHSGGTKNRVYYLNEGEFWKNQN